MTVKPGRHLATQTEYPWRTAIRTGVATFLLILAATAAASPIVGSFVDQYIPGAGTGVIGFGVFCGALALLIKRVGSIPAVAALMVRLGIGVVPRSDLTDGDEHDSGWDPEPATSAEPLQFRPLND